MHHRRSKTWKPIVVLVVLLSSAIFFLYIFQSGISFASNNKTKKGLNDEQILGSMGSRRTVDVIQPSEMTVYIQPNNLMLKNGMSPFIVILVTSIPNAIKERNLIRSSWYKWQDEYNIRVFFFLGLEYKNASVDAIQALNEESMAYNDLIVDDFQEGYYRLTPKVLRMLKWFLSTSVYKSVPKYFVKTDHDVFINIPNLVSQIHFAVAKREESYLVGGHYYPGEIHLDTDPLSKWYLTPEFWNLKKSILPNYLGGPCYILSGNIVESIYNASFSVPLFPFEDAYLTGMVAKEFLNLTLSNIPNITIDANELRYILSKPSKTIQAVALHPINPPEMMQTIYTRVLNNSSSSNKSFQVDLTLTLFLLTYVALYVI